MVGLSQEWWHVFCVEREGWCFAEMELKLEDVLWQDQYNEAHFTESILGDSSLLAES